MTAVQTAASCVAFSDLRVVPEERQAKAREYLAQDIEIASHIYTHEVKNLKLDCGVTIDARIGFTAIATNNGRLIDLRRFDCPELVLNRPVIIKNPALTGSAVSFLPQGAPVSQGDGWGRYWYGAGDTPFVGDGTPFIDTDRFTVICLDNFGGNLRRDNDNQPIMSTTSASDVRVELRSFISFSDGIELATRAFAERGVTEIDSVIGGSIGGWSAFGWAFQDRIKVNRIFDISGSAAQNNKARQFFEIQADLLSPNCRVESILNKFDLNFEEYLAEEKSNAPIAEAVRLVRNDIEKISEDASDALRLAIARKVGFLRFVPDDFYVDKKRRSEQAGQTLKSWLDYEGEKLVKRFTPEGAYCLANMNARAPSYEPERVGARLRETNTRLIGYYVIGDTLFPATDQQAYYEKVADTLSPEEQGRLLKTYMVEDRRNGHDHFLSPQFAKTGGIIAALRRELLGG